MFSIGDGPTSNTCIEVTSLRQLHRENTVAKLPPNKAQRRVSSTVRAGPLRHRQPSLQTLNQLETYSD